MVNLDNIYTYTLSEKEKEYCLGHAKKMCEGFKTYSFKNDKNQSEDVYYIGKIGELVFYKFLRTYKKDDTITITHNPFREKYDKMNFKDDFMVKVNNKTYQFEVRTKGRNVDPQLNYECCTDSIKPHLIYVFLSYNKKNDKVSLLGYATWNNFKNHAKVALKNDSNNNFTHKVNEFNIEVSKLNNIHTLMDELK